MSPTIALVLCTAYVIALLRIESKSSAGVSWQLWIPIFWIFYCACGPATSWFEAGQVRSLGDSYAAGNSFERRIQLTFIVLAAIVLMTRGFDWEWGATKNRWLFVLFAYMLISILWSDFVFVSFKRWFKSFGTLIIAFVVLTDPKPYTALQSLFRRTAYILIPYSILLAKYFPSLGMEFSRWSGSAMWSGVALNKNGLGVLCLICGFFLIWRLITNWFRDKTEIPKYEQLADLSVLAITFWLMVGGPAHSATSVTVLMLGLVVFIAILRWRVAQKNLTLCVTLSAIAVALFTYALSYFYDTSPLEVVALLAGRDPTLTGRTDFIWSQLLPVAFQNPVLGVGYGGYWVNSFLVLNEKLSVNQAHNGYLDVFLELGFVGLILLAIVIIDYFRKADAEGAWSIEWSSFRLSFLFMCLLHNWTESSFLKSTFLLWNVFILLAVVTPGNPASVPNAENDGQVE